MDVLQAIRSYCTNAVRKTPGMKVLLLDDETTPIISLALNQSEILKEEVYLFEKIGQENREAMLHLQAICFFRPSEDTLVALKKELRTPKYGTYYIYFTNTVRDEYLKEIAAADELEVIKEVQEYYTDYYAINPDTFGLGLSGPGVIDSNLPQWGSNLQRITDGLAACLLSLKIKPHVRVQSTSSLANQVGQQIKMRIENSSTFHVGQPKQNPPLLLIMDRCEDPVTPLLTAWTYQAMLHQLLKMKNNRMDFSHVPGVRDELKQIVVSYLQDDFYKDHMYDDLGDLGLAIQEFVAQFQAETSNNTKLDSIEDIKRFVEKFPDFKKTSGNVSKHLALMDQLQTQIGSRFLMEVSMVEQELACYDDHSAAVQHVRELLARNPAIESEDALRIVLLFALRYAHLNDNSMTEFVMTLSKRFGLGEDRLIVIRKLRQFGAAQRRTPGLLDSSGGNWFKSMQGKIKRGLVGVQNAFTQHEPLLKRILMLLRENKLDINGYPYITGQPNRPVPSEVIVFIVGGATFSEAALIHQLNKEDNSFFKYVLGSTGFIRPDEFVNDVLSLTI